VSSAELQRPNCRSCRGEEAARVVKTVETWILIVLVSWEVSLGDMGVYGCKKILE
jgi:hypothetical protein